MLRDIRKQNKTEQFTEPGSSDSMRSNKESRNDPHPQRHRVKSSQNDRKPASSNCSKWRTQGHSNIKLRNSEHLMRLVIYHPQNTMIKSMLKETSAPEWTKSLAFLLGRPRQEVSVYQSTQLNTKSTFLKGKQKRTGRFVRDRCSRPPIRNKAPTIAPQQPVR